MLMFQATDGRPYLRGTIKSSNASKYRMMEWENNPEAPWDSTAQSQSFGRVCYWLKTT